MPLPSVNKPLLGWSIEIRDTGTVDVTICSCCGGIRETPRLQLHFVNTRNPGKSRWCRLTNYGLVAATLN